MSTSSSSPFSSSLFSESSSSPLLPESSSPPVSPRALAINSLVQQWRRQNDLPVRGTAFQYAPPASSHPPATASPVPSLRVASPSSPVLQPTPPGPRLVTPEPLHQTARAPAPVSTPMPSVITISDWQEQEDSPALYVFLKNGTLSEVVQPAVIKSPVQQKSGNGEDVSDGREMTYSEIELEKTQSGGET